MGIIDKCGVRGDATLCVGIFTDFNLITKFWRFPWNIATDAASQQRTLTPPDTWSCPIWDLHQLFCILHLF